MGSAYLTHLLPLITAKKILVRIMFGANRFTQLFPIYVDLNILPLIYLYTYVFKGIYLFFKVSGGNSGVVIDNSEIVRYQKRDANNNKIKIPKVHLTLVRISCPW